MRVHGRCLCIDAKCQPLCRPFGQRVDSMDSAVDKAEQREERLETNYIMRHFASVWNVADEHGVLVPLVDCIETKWDTMVRLRKYERCWQELDALFRSHQYNLERHTQICLELDALEGEVCRYVAFEDKGWEQNDYITASSYADEWACITNENSELVACICSWYVCCATTGWDHTKNCAVMCLSVRPAKDWIATQDEFFPPTAWFCRSCGARYNRSWGQLVEITQTTASGQLERHYWRAAAPSWDEEDVRAMFHELVFTPSTPFDLFTDLQSIEPTCSSIVVMQGGCRRVVDTDAWGHIETCHWLWLFAVVMARYPESIDTWEALVAPQAVKMIRKTAPTGSSSSTEAV